MFLSAEFVYRKKNPTGNLMSPNKMFFSFLQAQMPLNKIIKLWPQPENR